MDQLKRQIAELALRLSALPSEGLRNDTQALDAIEELALQVLKQVSAARVGRTRPIGETSGKWPAMQILHRP